MAPTLPSERPLGPLAPPAQPDAARALGLGAAVLWRLRWRLAGGAAAMAAVGWLCARWVPQPSALLPACANLAAGARFAVTLRPGAEPLITRYTRFDMGGMPRELVGYTRALTVAWAALLLAAGTAQAVAAAGAWRTDAVLAVELALGLTLFLGEHWTRNRLFPQHGPATLRRTFAAIRAAGAEARAARAGR